MIRINAKILPDLAKFIEMRYGINVLEKKQEYGFKTKLIKVK